MAYEPIHLRDRKHVFIDWELIDPGYGLSFGGSIPESWQMPTGVQLRAHGPRLPANPLLVADRPWEEGDAVSGIGIYHTLMEDEGRFRLYYDAGDISGELDVDEDLGTQRILGYAESSDGSSWSKPELGIVSYGGSTANNLVYGLDASPGRDAHGASVFVDPSASKDERYKLVSMGSHDGNFCVYGAVSPDGVHWRSIEEPLIPRYLSDTQCVVRFDEAIGRYRAYLRGWTGHEHGTSHARRTIAYSETENFRCWPRPRQLIKTDMHDGPDTDIYTNSYTLWPQAVDAHLMFPALYHHSGDFTEVQLMTSRDGLCWSRLRQPMIRGGEPGTWSQGGVYAGCGLASLSAGEWHLPYTPRRASHNTVFFDNEISEAGILTAVWRTDGFVSLDADGEGSFVTVIVDFTGNCLQLNVFVRFGGELLIEVADASRDNRRVEAPAVAGNSFADCDPISGDYVAKTVTWRGKSDLSRLRGTPVRIRFRMRRAQLYAIQFVDEASQGRRE